MVGQDVSASHHNGIGECRTAADLLADLDDVALTATPPSGWDVTFDPKSVSGIKPNGSATIVAEAQSAHSRPVLVGTVEPKPGALLLTDAQIVSVGTPFAPDGGQDTLEGEVDVVLRNVAVPAQGTVVLGTESTALGGIVLSAQPQGGDVSVRIRLADLPELLARYDLDFSVPLDNQDIVMEVEAAPFRAVPTPGQRTPAYETKIEKSFPPSGNSPLKCEISGSASISGNLVSLKLHGDDWKIEKAQTSASHRRSLAPAA